MITDNDVKKLRETFATKDDLRYLKEDMEAAMDRQKKEIIDSLADLVQNGLIKTLDNHDERINKLEKRVFATT